METKQKIYNLKNDVIFKTFFSRKGNEIFLKDFLNALLGIEIERISIREEVGLEQLYVDEKGGRLDLQAELNDGIIVDIELQIRNEHNIKERTTTYASKTMSRSVGRGEKYEDIKQVIMVNILDYELFEYEEYVSETITVLKEHRECEVISLIKYCFVELPKFRKQHPDMNNKLNQWLAFLDDTDRGLIKMAEEKNKVLQKARIEMNELTGDAAVQRLAELREKWEIDRVTALHYAKKEGKEEGMKIKTEEIAKEMLKQGLSIEVIVSVTKLTREEIEKLM